MHPLNRILPTSLRKALRTSALLTIPSMRHLDMPMRLKHMSRIGFRPNTILDIGAADGEWSRLAAQLWPDAKIVAFEPNRSNSPKLEDTRRAIPGFAYHHCFLGAQPGQVTYDDQGTRTTLYASASRNTAAAEMRSLDQCFDASLFPQPDLVKIDVQGHELQVLRGGERVLRQCQAVLAEVNFFHFHPDIPTADDVIVWLRERGFVIYDVMGIYRLPEDDALGQMDFMFLKADHPLRGERRW